MQDSSGFILDMKTCSLLARNWDLANNLQFHPDCAPSAAMGNACEKSTISQEEVPNGRSYGPQYRKNVMFLCNHNSCRSQMADGWLRQLRGNASVGVASAGIVGGTAVKEGAITVMKDAGIDISGFTSDAMADFKPEDFDVVISCCGCGSKLDGDKEAWKKRPVFQDWNLDDPPAIDPGDLSAYRRVRDESKAKVLELLDKLSV